MTPPKGRPRSLTSADALLQEADLLAEGVDAVQLPEGVRQQAGPLRPALVRRWREEAADGRQHQLQLLQQQQQCDLQHDYAS